MYKIKESCKCNNKSKNGLLNAAEEAAARRNFGSCQGDNFANMLVQVSCSHLCKDPRSCSIMPESVILFNTWMTSHRFKLADTNTEVVMVTRPTFLMVIPMTVGRVEIQTRIATKYLGIIFDYRLRYLEHIQTICDRANRVASSISRLIEVSGPRPNKRRLLLYTGDATPLYSIEL